MADLGKQPEAPGGAQVPGLGSQFCPHEMCDLGQILNLSVPHILPQEVK